MINRNATSLRWASSGVRGLAGTPLTPRIAASFAAAFGTYAGPGHIVLGAAPRPSREMLDFAVTAGLLSVGCIPVQLGLVPLPAFQHYLRTHNADGGIAITGGHAPIAENALQCYGPDGLPLRPHRFRELIDLYHQGHYPRRAADTLPETESNRSAVDEHLVSVRALVNTDLLRRRRFKVVLDACNGAAFEAGPRFLRTLGCEVLAIHTDAGAPVRAPNEPQRADLSRVGAAVREAGADIGFALSPDAQGLDIVDEHGVPLGDDGALALGLLRILRRTSGPVVVGFSAGRGIDDLAANAGVPVLRAPEREADVVDLMRTHGAPVGGDGHGGLIVPGAAPGRDGFAAMALALETLAEGSVPMGRIRARLPAYPVLKQEIPCRPRDAVPFLALLKQIFRDEKPDLADGIQVRWPDRRLYVRLSRSESVLRIVAEARTEAAARALADLAADYFRPGAG